MSKTLRHKIEKYGAETVLEVFLKLQKHFAKEQQSEKQLSNIPDAKHSNNDLVT